MYCTEKYGTVQYTVKCIVLYCILGVEFREKLLVSCVRFDHVIHLLRTSQYKHIILSSYKGYNQFAKL